MFSSFCLHQTEYHHAFVCHRLTTVLFRRKDRANVQRGQRRPGTISERQADYSWFIHGLPPPRARSALPSDMIPWLAKPFVRLSSPAGTNAELKSFPLCDTIRL